MTAGSSAKSILEEASTAVQSKRPILKHKFEGHKLAIWSFVFLHDNIHIVSGSLDGAMRKWNCDTGLVVGEPWKGEGGKIYTLALSPDGKIIACGRADGSVQWWTTDGEMIGVWTGHSEWVRSLAWSPSGSYIASGSEDGTILIRTADNGRIEVGPINTEQTGVWSLAYSPSGGRIASGGWNKSICIWDTKTGKLVVGPITDMGNCYVTSVVWSSDSAKLYSASDRFARVFDSTSGELLHSFAHNDTLYSVALSPKNNVLACVGLQGIAQLWGVESHQPLGQPFHQEHHERLLCVSFSRDGKYVAYSGDDNKLTLWLVKDIASPLLEPALPDGQSTREETRSDSPSLSCLDVSTFTFDCLPCIADGAVAG
jgi:WD40 repeat protein